MTSSAPVLRATRLLAALLVVLSLALILVAVVALVIYSNASPDEDEVAAFSVFFGTAFGVIGVVELPIALTVARARRSSLVHGLAIPAGLWGVVVVASARLLVAGPRSVPAVSASLDLLVVLVPLSLVVLGVLGLLAGRRAVRS